MYLFRDVNPAADSTHDNVIVVCQLGKLSGFKNILVEFVVIYNWKNNLKKTTPVRTTDIY